MRNLPSHLPASEQEGDGIKEVGVGRSKVYPHVPHGRP